jgi:hypothetical protein
LLSLEFVGDSTCDATSSASFSTSCSTSSVGGSWQLTREVDEGGGTEQKDEQEQDVRQKT